jgi:hypothetical protein
MVSMAPQELPVLLALEDILGFKVQPDCKGKMGPQVLLVLRDPGEAQALEVLQVFREG